MRFGPIRKNIVPAKNSHLKVGAAGFELGVVDINSSGCRALYRVVYHLVLERAI